MTTNIIYEETLNLKTGVACKLNKLKPDKRHRDELEKLFYFMNQEHIKALMQSLGSYDKRDYIFNKNRWYIKFWFCEKKTLLLLSTYSCIVKTIGE
jgi:predicted glutamine amidotransferase|tara:strand:- start:1121 stop:1408 length:288 start_codon:yes stop_codon:yes gene_type:complete